MENHYTADESQGDALLSEMEKTIPQKVAVCAAHMLLKNGALVLDAGCADGVATAYFALSNPHVHVIGIDYDAQFIDKANERYGHIPNVEFIRDDLRSFDLGKRKLDAIVNLSILHEPYSYTGYRKKTIEEIIAAELKNLKPGGVIINRDFVLPDAPNALVYLALKETEGTCDVHEDINQLSLSGLLKLYSQEAMAFDNNDPEGHIKGFFLEEHTERVDLISLGLDSQWRIHYLPHHFAWEFIWRKEYRDRFYPEANEKYGFWTSENHREEPQKLGGRVSYAAYFENPWIFHNWYSPQVKLFDNKFNTLPLPPSNFISVVEKRGDEDATQYREHRSLDAPAQYLQLSFFQHKSLNKSYDLVARPGSDVVDVLPYSLHEGKLTIYAKHNFPRPILNSYPRLMTPNLDNKFWSGHVTEPLAAANIDDDWNQAVESMLRERAGFSEDELPTDSIINTELTYYTAPSELNERVISTLVEIQGEPVHERPYVSLYEGFKNTGAIQAYSAQGIIDAAQVGMLAEPRLELNVYQLCKKQGVKLSSWMGNAIHVNASSAVERSSIKDMLEQCKKYNVFKESESSSNWLDIVRSEFHEVERVEQRERVLSRRKLEFIVPNINNGNDVTTNSVMVFVLTRDKERDDVLIGLQKIDDGLSQFPAVQFREAYSGLICAPGLRLPKSVDHIQAVTPWLASQLGVSEDNVLKLGEGYFPSLGVMPNRVFPHVVTEVSEEIKARCQFVPLTECYEQLEQLQDMHLMLGIYRCAHALGLN